MSNAKEELVHDLENAARQGHHVVAASITHYGKYYDLPEGYTPQELSQWFDTLDFEYDSGYGLQELWGTVLLSEGAWLDRHEYDGCEWWVLRKRPASATEYRSNLGN